MQAFREPMREMEEFDRIKSRLGRSSGLLQVSGCVESQKAQFIDALGHNSRCRVIIAANDLRAREIHENYRLFDRDVLLFPARDFIFFQADIHSNLLEQERIKVWRALAEGKPLTVVTTMTALMNHLMPFTDWKKNITTLTVGDEMNPDEWKEKLTSLGYERCAQVESQGQFAIRGGIIDIFMLTEDVPVRIELFDTEIDSIRTFDAQSQRSVEELQEFTIYPAAEMILDESVRRAGLKKVQAEAKKQEKVLREQQKNEEAYRAKTIASDLADKLDVFRSTNGLDSFLDYFYPQSASIFDAFPEGTLYFLDEPNRLSDAADAAMAEFEESMKNRLEKGYALPGQTKLLYSPQQVKARLEQEGSVGLCMLDNTAVGWKTAEHCSLTVEMVNPYNNSFELLVKDLKKWKKEGWRVVLLCASRTRGARLAEDLRDEELNAIYTDNPERTAFPGEVLVIYGNTHRGYAYPLIRFAVITESDIFGKEKTAKKRKKKQTFEGRRISSFAELAPGDFVVHENHGLGVYKGIEKIEVNHVLKDYMKIEYAGGSFLYVQPSQLDVIQKYADADAKKPKLNKLGGQEWTKTKSKVRTAVETVAQELVDLYAARQREVGFEYGPDTIWQQEFEEMFPYEETEDQLKAIEETKRDMESTKIMDRLICGDVGYGKTEIAIRAAFKAVQENKQVALLVPTTILAQQHYNTFVQRLKDFPVRVDLMCRFRTSAQMKKTAGDLKRGLVDIVIGTHRILSKDVQFKNLGLLIVDEEQRFGVTHKEKIKTMRQNVDVLTLTATPIPRTLHMSLSGIRDMSVLEEAPQDRLPIQTFIMEYNEELVREAICRELARGGQVYYVFNRVNTIAEVASRIQELVPEAHVAYAHGQMAERELEGIMYDFINQDIDVLVSTTIVETGLDIANANTMIIDGAEKMGLSQLYQLRGRIGRSNRTAYAFLMYKKDKMLSEEAEKRLGAMREFTELGSGFKIAMRDLEIRGAGNLLGSAQSGHMAAVGYDLYCKLLNESVMALKGEKNEHAGYETLIDIDVDAYIPNSYIASEEQKLDIYKRIAAISNEEEYDDMADELMDRFKEPPRTVRNLLRIALIKAKAHELYLTSIKQRPDEIVFHVFEGAVLDATQITPLLQSMKGQLSMQLVRSVPTFIYSRPKAGKPFGDHVLDTVEEVLNAMRILEKK